MKKRILSLLLVLAMALCLLPSAALAASPADELDATVSGYYQSAEGYALDDWEELAAVYAASAGGSYASAVDIWAYRLPETPVSGAGAVFAALMKGDGAAAKTAAEGLVSAGILADPGYAYGVAANMLAVEAYNRSAASAIAYDKSAAIAALLGYRNGESSGGSADGYGYLGYYDGLYYDDFDTAGIALAALALCSDTDRAGTEAASAALAGWMKTRFCAGASSAWNANSLAMTLIGMHAYGDYDLTGWATTDGKTPVETLLTFYVAGGGFRAYSDSADAFATKQAALALAEQVNGVSFYKNLKLNPNHYTKAVTFQAVTPDGGFIEKSLSLTDADTLDTAAAKALGVGSVNAGDYTYYKNGAAAQAMADGDAILAVYKDFTSVALFSAEGGAPGEALPAVAFGGSVSLKLCQLGGSPLAGVPIDLNGDGYGDVTTGTNGGFTLSPIEARTALTAIKSDYSGTYIPEATAVIPAYITMLPGVAQTKTVALRIEGKTKNILNYSAFDVTGDGSRRLTVYDAVTQALTAAGVTYSASSGYISAIGGQAAGASASAYDGWLYLYNGSSTWTGMAAQTVSDGDGILVYYGYSLGYGTDTAALTSSVSGGALTLTVTGSAAPIEGAAVTLTDNANSASSLSGVTDASGQVTFQPVSAGTYAAQISKADADGVPQLIRLAPGATVTVTSDGSFQGGGSGDTQTAKKVAVTVSGPSSDLLARTEKTWYVGMTALDALKASGLELVISSNGAYVSSVGGAAEFDYGANSGWKYKVNNAIPQTPASEYVLSPSDELVWYYVRDYALDSDFTPMTASSLISPVAAVSGGKASVSVTAQQLESAAQAAAKAGSEAVAIAPKNTGSAAQVSVSLPAASANTLAEAKLSLTIKTESGSVTLPAAALASAAGQAALGDITVTIAAKSADSVADTIDADGAAVISVSVSSGGKPVTEFGGETVEISIPVDGRFAQGKEYQVIEISENGETRTLSGKCVKIDGGLAVQVSAAGLSDFVVTPHLVMPFTDVEGHWGLDAIQYVFDAGMMKGAGETLFSPDAAFDRAMLVTVLYRLAGEPAVTGESAFGDVPAGQWYTDAVIWAAEQDIIKGRDDGTFGPEDEMTREQMAAVLYRYEQHRGGGFTGAWMFSLDFSDGDMVSGWAYEAMCWCAMKGIIGGKDDGTLSPADAATRAEAAAMLMRFAQNDAK